jgi:hypothetical protein
MMLRKPALKALVATSIFLALGAMRSHAQSIEHSAYFAVDAGVAAEPPELSVRSRFGLALGAGAGRALSSHVALEARLGGEFFGAPTQFYGPGGCLGVGPCNLETASSVHVIALSADGILSSGARGTGARLLVGGGARYISATPEDPSDLRPFVEIGCGVARSFAAASIGLDARFQLAAWTAEFPRWTMPIGISVRFF